MNYCSSCGAKVALKIPDDDHLPRHVCTQCSEIFYINPKVIVGTLPIYDGKILLCKRGIEPRLGRWTLPAGFMECWETLEEGASRETHEESEAILKNLKLLALVSIPHIAQVYVIYKAQLATPHFATTPESTDVALFAPEDIPWDELAFPVMTSALQHYVTSLESGNESPLESIIDFRDDPRFAAMIPPGMGD